MSAAALFFALERLLTSGQCRRPGSKLGTLERVRACFAALWGWPLSGEKPVSAICFRCERSKVILLLDGLVVDSATLAESDTPGVGPKAARNRAIRTHRIRGRCFSVRYLFVPFFLFLNTAKSQDDHTAKRLVMVTFDFFFLNTAKSQANHRAKRQGIHAANSQVTHLQFHAWSI